MNDIQKALKKKFATGFMGFLSLKPFKKTVTDKFFIVAFIISLTLDIFVFRESEKQLDYIEMFVTMIFSIIPAVLGLSLAGFAIVISQISEKTLKKITDVDVEKEGETSLYQDVNIVFTLSVLAQFVPLIIAILINLIKPISLQILVTPKTAIITNIIILHLESWAFFYALFSIVDLAINIFTMGQIVNFIFAKNKIEKNSQGK
jgi:hypothetical protein